MSEHDMLISALERLHVAAGLVEQAVERRESATSDARIIALQEELARVNQDRAALGDEIDRLNAHAKTLESANADVGQRLDKAIETIKTVLEPQA